MLQTKACTRCTVDKPLGEFFKGKGPHGKHSWCKPCVLENRNDHYRQNPEMRKRNELWSRYRLRPEDVERMLLEQGSLCCLCDRDLNDVKYHVDHDHKTGTVRGLLCPPCNKYLGWFENRPDRVVTYLGL